MFWWGEYETDVGDRVIAKRHVAASVPLGLAAVMVLMVAGSTMLRHRTSVVAASRPVTAVAPRLTIAPSSVAESAGRAAASDDRLIPRTLGLPMPPVALPTWSAAAAAPAARDELATDAPGDPLVFTAHPDSPPPTTAARGVGPDTSSAAGAPIVYDRERDRAASENASTGAVTSPAASRAADASADARQRWEVGARIAARMATGVLVAAGGSPSPAIAESADPPATWVGQARFGTAGRVEIAFALSQQGRTVRGIALDPDHLLPGLAGHTELRHPQAAVAALTAAATAAAAYARALAQQGLALTGEWGQLTVGQAASPWSFLAASAADEVAPRSGVPGPVETSEIPAGTPLLILVTEAS